RSRGRRTGVTGICWERASTRSDTGACGPDLLRCGVSRASQLIQYSLPGLGGIDAQVPEGLRAEVPARVALRRADQAEQQVLGADVGVVQRSGFLHRELDRLLCLPRHRDPSGRLDRPRGLVERARAEGLLDPAP